MINPLYAFIQTIESILSQRFRLDHKIEVITTKNRHDNTIDSDSDKDNDSDSTSDSTSDSDDEESCCYRFFSKSPSCAITLSDTDYSILRQHLSVFQKYDADQPPARYSLELYDLNTRSFYTYHINIDINDNLYPESAITNNINNTTIPLTPEDIEYIKKLAMSDLGKVLLEIRKIQKSNTRNIKQNITKISDNLLNQAAHLLLKRHYHRKPLGWEELSHYHNLLIDMKTQIQNLISNGHRCFERDYLWYFEAIDRIKSCSSTTRLDMTQIHLFIAKAKNLDVEFRTNPKKKGLVLEIITFCRDCFNFKSSELPNDELIQIINIRLTFKKHLAEYFSSIDTQCSEDYLLYLHACKEHLVDLRDHFVCQAVVDNNLPLLTAMVSQRLTHESERFRLTDGSEAYTLMELAQSYKRDEIKEMLVRHGYSTNYCYSDNTPAPVNLFDQPRNYLPSNPLRPDNSQLGTHHSNSSVEDASNSDPSLYVLGL